MSDARKTGREGDASTSAGMEMPEDANEEDFSEDEITEATPPNAEDGEKAPEAN
jgi:hypothetical protein